MLVTFQIPMFDARPFLPDDRGRQSGLPVWTAPKLGVDFIRGWGTVEKRRRGGHAHWVAEGHYCDASRALRFEGVLSQQRLGPVGNRCHIACAFRRLFGSQTGFLRVEVGFSRRNRERPRRPLDGPELLDLIREILRVPTAIGERPSKRSLTELGPALASYYLYCTTVSPADPAPPLDGWLVQAGAPMIFVAYHASEVRDPLPFALAAETPGMALDVHCNRQLPVGGSVPVSAWSVALDGRPSSSEQARTLRINLLRRHSERECLRIVLQLLARKRLDARGESPQSRDLRRLLDWSGHVFNQVNGSPSPGDHEAELAFRLDELLGPGDRRTIMEGLTDLLPAELRDQLQLSDSQFHITINGPATVNDNRVSTGNILGEHIAIGHSAAA